MRLRRRLPPLPGGNDTLNCAGAMGEVPGYPDWNFWMQNYLEGEKTAPWFPETHHYFYFVVQRLQGKCSPRHVLGPFESSGTWEWEGGWCYFAPALNMRWPLAWVAHAGAQPELAARFHALARCLERAVFQQVLDTTYRNLREGWGFELERNGQCLLTGEGGRTWGPFRRVASALWLASEERAAPGTKDVLTAASVRGHWRGAPVQVLEKLWHRLTYPPPAVPLGPLFTPRKSP